jgi:photosynthetic reaction center cytochrome c subunit
MAFGSAARATFLVLLGGFGILLSGCERPPVDVVQRGYRGTAMEQVYNPRTLESQAELNTAPAELAPARVRANAPKAGQAYQNVQVLGDLSLGEFGRTMNAITAWVSPTQACAYCHVEGNFADDSKYTKVVARRMLQMTQHLNSNWKAHVGQTGVTCYTCHRGNPLPVNVWFKPLAPELGSNFIGARNGQNAPAPAVGLASLPSQPFADYFTSEASAKPIRVAGTQALPAGNRSSIQQAEHTYALMMHMSKSLGVNCTYCHNSRAFASWPESTPQRSTAWHGIRMVRDLNSQFLDPLSGTFPEVPLGRLGPAKDAAKVNCATCHQGAYKPLYGAAMAKGYPALMGADEARAWMERALAEAAAAAAAAEAAAASAAAASQPR